MRLRTQAQTFTVPVGDGEVDVRTVAGSELQELQRKHTKTRFIKGKAVDDFDAAAFGAEVFCRTVQAWRGFTDAGGQPLPCDPATKRGVWEHEPAWCAQVLEAAEEAARVWREQTLGNS